MCVRALALLFEDSRWKPGFFARLEKKMRKKVSSIFQTQQEEKRKKEKKEEIWLLLYICYTASVCFLFTVYAGNRQSDSSDFTLNVFGLFFSNFFLFGNRF